ncbi:uncharacterized protein TRAVEDRAFT_28743 [Trametes versicolor FP-101664 SS1]|uniref:uncharacterized protein n=1 Tax=Trametes versicolor (strain FP-101664) TaxID=717944 RepID=UPI0004623CD2|nr:uncharacterized protein TRAVEDRAFT_28743 [Trametes versicolor FP-101664 SS1]EIW59701.1 hypothetical protein TRAVEDRAFT_28743 [Trametes versicolor FP-101664 SS1]
MPIATEVSPRGSCATESQPLRQIVTQDLQRGSPAPRFEVEKPRGRSLSPVRSRVAAAQAAAHAPAPAPVPAPTFASASTSTTTSASASTSTPAPVEKYVAPPLTWRTAAQDAKAGIYYTKDEFPSSSFLPPPFSREPVQVHGGERVEVLQEVDEYAVRVRVLRTGMTGLIPAWNTEGALDRLTRINTAFNEAATCPTEARALRRRFSESAAVSHNSEDTHYPSPTPSADPSLAHVHSRCISFTTRVRFGEFYANPSAFEDSSSSDSDDPDTPQSPSEPDAARGRKLLYACAEPGVYRAPSRTLEGGISARSQSAARKSVVFPKTERPQVVFRYPSEELVEVLHEEKREGSVEEEDEDDEEWWWHGWEEPLEESDSESAAEEEQRGRTLEAKTTAGGADAMQGVVDQDGLSRWLVAIQEEEQ